MGSLVVVARSEGIEARLRLGQGRERVLGEDLPGNRAVEPLDLALGLRVLWPPMPGRDP